MVINVCLFKINTLHLRQDTEILDTTYINILHSYDVSTYFTNSCEYEIMCSNVWKGHNGIYTQETSYIWNTEQGEYKYKR